MNFLVVCINDGGWYDDTTGRSCIGPKLNEVCEVFDSAIMNGDKMYKIVGYDDPSIATDGYEADQFVPYTKEKTVYVSVAEKLKEQELEMQSN